MLVDTLIDKLPQWVLEDGPDAPVAVCSFCSVSRNLADYPFTHRCTNEDKQAIEARVLGVLDALNLLHVGQYYALPELDAREARFLAERHLITLDLLQAQGPRGVFVSEDQGLCIMVNGVDHLCIRTLMPGLQLQEAWTRLNGVDDTLSGALDFAFDERLGFLTPAPANVGCALKASVLLHLPALSTVDTVGEVAVRSELNRVVLRGVKPGIPVRRGRTKSSRSTVTEGMAPSLAELAPPVDQAIYSDGGAPLGRPWNEAEGALYSMVNQATLGVSEQEILFQVRHEATVAIAEEQQAREALIEKMPYWLDDRLGRAQGIAAGARMLGLPEAMDLLSSMRLGLAAGTCQNTAVSQLNELLLAAQGAHIEMACGRDCDALTLSMERADLFRGRFFSPTGKV